MVDTSAPVISPRRRAIIAIAIFALTGAGAVAYFTRGIDRWPVLDLLVIVAYALGSEFLSVRTDFPGAIVSGSFLGILLSAVLYGPAPAAAIGVLTTLFGWLHTRERLHSLAANLANWTLFPLVGGLAFHGLATLGGVGAHDAVYYLYVFIAFAIALAVNIAIFSTVAWADRGVTPRETLGALVAPVMASELFSAALTVVAAWVVLHLHLVGLIMFGLVLVLFQYLTGEMLRSRQRMRRLQRIATTDELTGLANRTRFREIAAERVAEAAQTGTGFAVMLMDLDRFKEVNDTLGHLYGDRLLTDLGRRLAEIAGPDDLIARLGGDEFAALVRVDVTDEAAIERSVVELQQVLTEPFLVDELSLEVGASIGVARFPRDGENAESLLRCADIAMYAAKDAQTGYRLYAADENHHSVRRLSVLSEIRHAMASDQIVVHYQPIVDVGTGTVIGAEGLVRWEHPEHGLIPPGGFVQTVEQTGLIGPLTRHVLEHAIAECARWRAGGRELSVAVNLSVRNLLDRDLPRQIERLLDTYRVPADALQLEITESMIMSDPERAMATVGRLSELGARLSVDDFGTGYSSLANLRRLPIDELKIDRSFVSPMLADESDLIIVRSTINLGHDLGLRIIAEGVEDGATLERLAMLGCDLAQGFHLSRPMAAPAFTEWLKRTSPPRRGPARTDGGWAQSPSGVLYAVPQR